MKRLFAGVFAAAMALNLAACGGGASETTTKAAEDKAQASSEPREITLKLSFNGDFTTLAAAVAGAADRVSDRYALEGQNIRVKVEADLQTIDNNDFHNNIVFAHKSGDSPDMFLADPDVSGFVKAGCVLDITDAITDGLADHITIPCTVDGKVYMMPGDLPLRVMYYNTDILKKIGWTQEQIDALPKRIASGEFTMEQFMALCREVVDKKAAAYGLVHRPSAGNDFYDLLNAMGGDYYNDQGQLVFDETGIHRMFELLYNNAQVSRITPDNLNQMGWDTINKMVGTGEAFAYFGPMFSATYVADAAGLDIDTFAKQEAFVLFPKSEHSDAAFCTAAPQFLAISRDTKYPEICKDIFREMQSGSADLMAAHSAGTFSLSSVKKANTLPQITQSPILAPVTYMADHARFIPALDNANTLRGLMFDQISALELGQTTPDKAISDLKTQAKLNIDGLIMK